jgi:surface antigen
VSNQAPKPRYGLPWLAALVLASCAAQGPGSSQDTFYNGLSVEEAAIARQAVQQALETRPSDDALRWNHGNGSSGSVTPLRTFRIKTGHYCRDFAETVNTGAQPVSAVRTACRGSQGTWGVVKR